MTQAEQLAKRWMKGRREGSSGRRAWEHPADLVRVLTEEMPITGNGEELEKMVALAWLHDLLEDGKKEDGTSVSMYDLQDEEVDGDIVNDILALTQKTLRTKEGRFVPEEKSLYLARLKWKSPRARLVKCVDRICNLREGKDCFKTKRWIRYVGETYYFIYPLAEDLPAVERNWLRIHLVEAVQARKFDLTELAVQESFDH